MKLSDARKIVGEMCQWEMFHMGIIDERPENINYSLEDMLKANKIVRKRNSVQKEMVVGKTYRRTMQTVLCDRLIAAMYVAMQYKAQNQSITCCNGNYIGVFK